MSLSAAANKRFVGNTVNSTYHLVAAAPRRCPTAPINAIPRRCSRLPPSLAPLHSRGKIQRSIRSWHPTPGISRRTTYHIIHFIMHRITHFHPLSLHYALHSAPATARARKYGADPIARIGVTVARSRVSRLRDGMPEYFAISSSTAVYLSTAPNFTRHSRTGRAREIYSRRLKAPWIPG